ncbi:hypothetical protein ACW5CM_07355 [Microbacterium sp. A588]
MPRDNRFLDFFTDALRQGARSHVEDAFNSGFNTAANLAVGALSESIDNLLSKITDVGPLSDAEQLLLAQLTRTRTDIEGRLHRYAETAVNE